MQADRQFARHGQLKAVRSIAKSVDKFFASIGANAISGGRS